jgi:hypothetical protein
MFFAPGKALTNREGGVGLAHSVTTVTVASASYLTTNAQPGASSHHPRSADARSGGSWTPQP